MNYVVILDQIECLVNQIAKKVINRTSIECTHIENRLSNHVTFEL